MDFIGLAFHFAFTLRGSDLLVFYAHKIGHLKYGLS